ncbi:MAG: GGDEF domain-containing protein [Solirubrobacterales bacterium]
MDAPKGFASEGLAGETAGDGEHAAELDSLIRFIALELGAEAAMLTVHDGRPGEPHVYATWGLPLGPTILQGVSGQGSIGHALERNKPIARRLDGAEHNGNGNGASATVAHGLIAPVKSPSGVRGALTIGYVASTRERRDAALVALASYAAMLGLWIDDSEALVGLLRASHRDALTGCLTYPALVHQLEDELRRSSRTQQPLSCLFIDLDGFKRVNDSDGHLAGNRVLRTVADAIRGRIRSTDTLARFGGDEFVVLLPDTSTLRAELVAEALRETIADAGAESEQPAVTASIGVAELQAGMSSADLLDRADAALRSRRRTAALA